MSDWAEQYKHPLWQKKRLEVFEMDGWKCRRCKGKDDTLHAHHAYYEKGRMPWEYPDEAFVTLCDECHTYIHFIMDELKMQQRTHISDGYEMMLGYAIAMNQNHDSSRRFHPTCGNILQGYADYYEIPFANLDVFLKKHKTINKKQALKLKDQCRRDS